MASLTDIPFYGAYKQVQQANEQAGMDDLKQAGALQAILASMQNQQAQQTQHAAVARPEVREAVFTGAANGKTASARVSNADNKVLAVPSARRVARELGIDLGSVPASGRGGIVRRADVEAFAQSGAGAPAQAAPSQGTGAAPARPTAPALAIPTGERETRIPFRGVRRKISEAMVRSKFTAPHFTVVEEVDVTQLVALKDQAKAMHAASGVKITFMPFIMKATAMALAQHPMLNAHLAEVGVLELG